MWRLRVLVWRRSAVGLVLLACLVSVQDVLAYSPGADEPTADTVEDGAREPWERNDSLHYGNKGLEFHPPDSATELWLGLRFQTRYDGFKGDLTSLNQLQGPKHSGVDFRRGWRKVATPIPGYEEGAASGSENRFRLQWELSL